MLRPGTKVYGRHTLSERLLEEEYKDVCSAAQKEIGGKMATLSVDGWSNLTNQPVLGVSVDHWLIDTVDTGGKPHNSEYVAEVMRQGVIRVI